MYPFRNVLIALDMSDMDQTLLRFAQRFYETEVADNVYFVNIIRKMDIPDSVLKEFPDMVDKALSERKAQIRQVIEEGADAPLDPDKTHIVVREGGIAKTILAASQELNIDLIVLGRRQQGNDGGLLSQRIARRAACSMLIVPEHSNPQVNKLLVPSDFSEFSTLALEEAVMLARRRPSEVEVVVQNVYTIPSGYHYSGKTKEEFKQILIKNAKKDYQAWVAEVDTEGINVRDVYSNNINDNVVSDIYDMAHELEVDGIVFGAKGRTSATAFFIGSIAEKVIQLDSKFPLLVVRPKGKNAGLLDILREI